MNILVVSAVLPYPLYSGGQVRLYNLLKRLSKNHKITLVSYIRSEEEKKYCKDLSFCYNVKTVLRGYAWQMKYILSALLTDKPLLLSTYDNSEIKQVVTQCIKEENIQLIHIEPGYVFPALPDTTIPIVVGEHNIEHSIYEDFSKQYNIPIINLFLKNDVRKLKKWEQKIWKKAAHILTVSMSDAKTIITSGFENVTVVPNGVDEQWFTFHSKYNIPTNFRAVFIGNFKWIQNKNAVKTLLHTIWPIITKNYPKATLELVGKHFPQSLSSYLKTSVTLTEDVEDIRDVLKRSHMSFAPITIGGGTKYKILEAMAAGVPVITTQKGTEGLDVKKNESILIAETVNDWLKHITRLCNDSVFTKRLTANARAVIEEKYSWSHISDIQNAVWTHVYEQKKS